MKINRSMALQLAAGVLAAGLFSTPALAQEEPVGYVKTLTGNATITTGTNKVKAAVGTGVFQGSQIQTEPGSSMGVTFKDNTIMSFGPDTRLTVDEYVYNPNQGKVKFGSKLAKGTVNYVSGASAKMNPEAVAVKTPTGTIGVRGTHFVAKVDEGQP